jgi:hypothetical protein
MNDRMHQWHSLVELARQVALLSGPCDGQSLRMHRRAVADLNSLSACKWQLHTVHVVRTSPNISVEVGASYAGKRQETHVYTVCGQIVRR